MSVYLNNFSISAGFDFFAKRAIHVADRLTEITFHILDGATASFGRLLPDLRPISVGNAILQIKKTGSALFETSEGDVLVEITQDKQGRHAFQAIGEMLKPVVFVEGKKRMSGALWEVKVSNYLQKLVGNTSCVDYGVCAKRWKGDKFADLKKIYSAEGLLRKKGDEVLLKLPEEPPMTFDGPQASLKAEIVLKHFYQRRKTPMEEDQSKHWDLLNRLFVGYLYFSSYALAPWVNDHVLLPHQRAQREEEKAQRMAADGYLDEYELREMAQNSSLRQRVMDMAEAQSDGGNTKLLSQLDGITFEPNGYSQTYEYDGKSYEDSHVFAPDKEVHSRTVCPKRGFCEEFLTEKDEENLIYTQKKYGTDKIDVQKATFKKEGDEWKLVREEKYEEGRILRLPDRSFGSTVLDQAKQLATHTATAYFATVITGQNSNIALISSLFHLIGQTKCAPVPQLRQVRDIKSIPFSSMMRTTVPITILYPLPDLWVEPDAQLTYNINLQSQFQLSSPNQNLELYIQQANGQPAPEWITVKMGALTPVSSLYLGGMSANMVATNVYVVGNYAYVLLGASSASGSLNILDISNLKKPFVVGSLLTSYPRGGHVKGNYLYFLESMQLRIIDVSAPANPTLVTTNSNFGGYQMASEGNYLYFATYNVTKILVNVVSISNPTSPTQIGSLSINSSQSNSCIYVSGNNVFIGAGILCYIVDVSVPSNPVLLTTLSLQYGISSISVKENYLLTVTNIGFIIYDISTISNPVLVKTVYVISPVLYHTLSGNYIYASSINLNLIIIDITNVAKAQIIASMPTSGSIYSTFLSNNNIFLANGPGGLSIFNAGSRVLSGTPSASNRGLLQLNVTAQDDFGDAIVDPIAIHIGYPTVAIPIPNQQVYVGNTSLFTVPAGTFEFPNANFIYSAKLVGGLPLPTFINFDPDSRTFLFTPNTGDQNTYRIQITGDDSYGGTIATTFDLVVPDRIPVLAVPLGNQTAYTGVFFEYIVASGSFTDVDHDELEFTANLLGSNALPGWLSFDPALRRFYGTPFGRNTYQIQMHANDEFGGMTSTTFTITVPSSAPILMNPVGTQLANIGTPFSFTFNSNTFYGVDGDPLTYSTSTLPSFLIFNGPTRTFTGSPQMQDAGTHSITIYAKNPFGDAVSSIFSLSVISSTNVIPPVLVFAIPDLKIPSGIPFNTTFSVKTFEDPQNGTLTYTATIEGGAPLPNGLYFNANTLTLSGTVSLPQVLRISIIAANPYGAFAIDTFTLTVIDGAKYHPTVLNPLPDITATVGSAFFSQVPANTFQDISGEPLTITVTQAGNQPLPDWLKWNAKTLSFSGTPGLFDTNTYASRQLTIDVWAADNVSSVKTSFIITVQGESFWALFIKYGFSFGTVAVSALGVWKERALIWNYLCKEKYQKGTQTTFVGKPYSHNLKLSQADIKEIRVLSNGKALPQLKPFPDGLVYKDDKFGGIPTDEDIGRFTVRVIDHGGYISEEFELIIKNEGDPDPEKQVSYHENARMQLSSLCTRLPSTETSDEGRFGKSKSSLLSSQEMITLNEK